MPDAPAIPRFDLLNDPWIPCVGLDDEPKEYGILDVLGHAHELREVRDPSPLVTYGLDRLLLAVIQDRLAPQDPSAWVALHQVGRFDLALIDQIRREDGDRFDLFHHDHPLFQTGDVPLDLPAKEKKAKAKPVGYLRAEIPTATNVNHFQHVYDANQAHCPACAARGLVTLSPFAQSGGSGIKPSINGEPPVYVWLTGRSLFDSLMLNTVLPLYRPAAAAPTDAPGWRGDGKVLSKDERTATGFVESLTWLPRRVRLFPSEGGRCSLCGRVSTILVREMIYEQGRSWSKDAPWWRDPFLAYRVAKDRAPRALQLREGRSLWRDFAILFLPLAGHIPAAVIEQAAMMAEIGAIGDPREHPIECFSVRTDKAKVFEWRWERLPFSPRLVLEPERAATIERALDTGEQVESILRLGLKKLYPRDGGGNRKAFERQIGLVHRSYWGALATPFRELVLGADRQEADLETLEIAWNGQVETTARSVFERCIDSFDVNAKALRRAEAARRFFYTKLSKLNPSAASVATPD